MHIQAVWAITKNDFRRVMVYFLADGHICGIQKSNKKHFMKNVKECRDVIVKKVLEQGWDTHITHMLDYDTLHRCLILYVIVINHSRGLFAIYKHDSRGLRPRVSAYISQTNLGSG